MNKDSSDDITNVSFNSTGGLPNTYNYINNVSANPVVLLIITVIIIAYYVLFASLGINNKPQVAVTPGLSFIETLMWSIFILLVLLNGTRYFFGITATADVVKLLSDTPEVDITIHDPNGTTDNSGVSSDAFSKEVYHIPGNKYKFTEAKALCDAYGSELATYKQVEDAYGSGAEWCSQGWSADQMVLYPTQMNTWKKLQKNPEQKHFCGRPGINGGYIANPNVQFGVNCYGYKPKMTPLEGKIMADGGQFPKSKKEIKFDSLVTRMKQKLSSIMISPFNTSEWHS